ncbi:MAG: alkaline phosphatase family protein [Armatimonadota bacterium]
MAQDSPVRVMILGVDAPIVPRTLKYVDEGDMPTLKSLIDQGTLALNCMVPYPTITPPNWTTIVTGAWPGTHGITCFHVHNPGDPLDLTHAGFDSADNQAEFLWEALERDDKRSIVLNYPSTWPPRMGDLGVQVAGAGLAPNEWRHHFEALGPWDVRNDVSGSQLFATDEYPRAQAVEPQPAEGWSNAPDGADLEVELSIEGRTPLSPLKPQTWWGLILKGDSGSYERLLIATEKDAAKALCELGVGQWSDRLEGSFETEAGSRRAAFKFKLLELSRSGRELKLFLSPLCAVEGYHHPEDVAAELEENVAEMPLPVFGIEELNLEWIDDDTWGEIMWEAHRWLGNAAGHLLSSRPWDLYAMHLHCPDWAYHAMATRLDPLTEPDAAVRERYEKLEREFHRAWDEMLATILQNADDNTIVVVVSDHGAQATTGRVPIRKILADAGLLTLKQDDEGNEVVDWSQTKAVVQRSSYVYVNLKGRDPQGIVEPGQEYEQVRDQITDALMGYTDPETGLRPYSFVLRREDARVLGLYGDRVGDVVFGQRPEFCGQHGPILPTAKIGLGSVEGLLVIKGPGIKQGAKLERNAWLVDVVPTVCHLAEWPLPAQAEGAVLYQALDDPDAKTMEHRKLRRNYQRLKRAEQTDEALTHRYNM